MELLKELCETPGIPGREEKLRAIVRRELEGVVDEMRVDTLGNLICVKRAAGRKKLMIAAHMDEIGFMVSYVDDKGFIRLVPLGGHDPRNMMAQRVTVQGKQDLVGLLYPGQKPTHLLTDEERKQQPKVSDFFVDVGLPGERVKELVPVGSPVTLLRDFVEVGDSVSCKAMDNRLAVYIMIKAMQQAKRFAFETVAVATSQEEVGLRGAEVSAFGVEPDVGVALDVTLAVDLPGVPDHERVTQLGGGTAIKLMDSSHIAHPGLVEAFKTLAEKRGIPYQWEVLPRGGTDAGTMQRIRAGVPVITLSTPTRYVHTSMEMVSKADIEASVNLMQAFVEEGDSADLTLK
ncbi:MAG: M42 family peptidase [Candidatus Latescibacteria bacterium]|nr:M42 family peptidase [Candidatus Latescibacterota bacterium]